MATIESRNGKYRVVFRFRGKRYTRSLRTTSKQVAKASLARLEDTLRRLELGTLELPHDADVATFLLSDARVTKKKKGLKPRTVGALLNAFMDELPGHSIEQSTRQLFEIHMRHLNRHLDLRMSLGDLQLTHIQDYVNERAKEKGIRGRTVSPSTIKKEIVTLTTAWRWGRNNGIVDRALPKAGLRLPKGVEKPRFQTRAEIERRISRGGLSDAEEMDLWDCLFLTQSEISELLSHVKEAARHSFIYPMFVFAAHTGARRSEILRSQVEDIELDAGTLTIREKKRVHGKSTVRSVPISPLLKSVLAHWLDSHPGGLFTFGRKSLAIGTTKAVTRDEAQDHFRRTLSNSRWSVLRGWHVFRHSFCSNCAAAGVDQRVINSWVGHQTEEMVRRYRHLIPSNQQSELARVFGESA